MDLIVQPTPIKKVYEYDFVLTTGLVMPVTIDHDAGDTIQFGDKQVVIHQSPKAHLFDPTASTGAEDITIFVQHLASVQRREREIVEMTPEQKFQYEKTLKELAGTSTTN
jgi:hypothetical protein